MVQGAKKTINPNYFGKIDFSESLLGSFSLGVKGESFLDAGYVVAPYRPLIVTPSIFTSPKVEVCVIMF